MNEVMRCLDRLDSAGETRQLYEIEEIVLILNQYIVHGIYLLHIIRV